MIGERLHFYLVEVLGNLFGVEGVRCWFRWEGFVSRFVEHLEDLVFFLYALNYFLERTIGPGHLELPLIILKIGLPRPITNPNQIMILNHRNLQQRKLRLGNTFLGQVLRTIKHQSFRTFLNKLNNNLFFFNFLRYSKFL